MVILVRSDVAVRDTAQRVAIELARRLESRGLSVLPRVDESAHDAERVLAEIEALFFALQTERAASDAQAFIEALERGEHGHAETALLVRALLLVAEACAAIGDGVTSDAAIDRALGADPSLTLDPARYSPVLRARVDARRARMSESVATLTLPDLPARAEVSIDGRVVESRSPRVRVGRRLVQIAAPGFAVQSSVVIMEAQGKSLAFEGRITPNAIDAIAGDPGTPLAHAARDAIDTLDADAWVLDARIVEGSASYRWWREASQVIERAVEVDASPDQIAELLDDGERSRQRDAAREERTRHRRRVAGWVSGAVAVAAGAITTGVVLRPMPPTRWRGQGTIEGGE